MKILFTVLLLLFTGLSSFAQGDEPDPEEFITIDVEPTPLVPLQSLVRYPEAAKKAGKEGRVIISVLINESGKVMKTRIEKSSDPLFDAAAKEALMAATFSPALHEGKPVKLWYTVPIMFRLVDDVEEGYEVEKKDTRQSTGWKRLHDSLEKPLPKKK